MDTKVTQRLPLFTLKGQFKLKGTYNKLKQGFFGPNMSQ